MSGNIRQKTTRKLDDSTDSTSNWVDKFIWRQTFCSNKQSTHQLGKGPPMMRHVARTLWPTDTVLETCRRERTYLMNNVPATTAFSGVHSFFLMVYGRHQLIEIGFHQGVDITWGWVWGLFCNQLVGQLHRLPLSTDNNEGLPGR